MIRPASSRSIHVSCFVERSQTKPFREITAL